MLRGLEIGWAHRERLIAFLRRRVVISSALHVAAWTAAGAGAVWLCSAANGAANADPSSASGYAFAVAAFLIPAFVIKGATAWLDDSFRDLWRHTCVEDLGSLIGSALGACVLLTILIAVIGPSGVALTVPLVDAGLTIMLLGLLRISPRLVREVVEAVRARRGPRLVLVGRMEVLDLELRRLRGAGQPQVHPVALLVEEPTFEGARLRRVKLVSLSDFERLLKRGEVAEVRVVPPLSEALLRSVTERCRAAGVPCRPTASLSTLAEVIDRDAALLLDRSPVRLDEKAIARVVGDKCVLVTGGGGSIGSELARQIASFHPRTLILVDRSENALFHIECSLKRTRPDCHVVARLVDVRDSLAVGRLFRDFKPEVVFHAAAHKHVPMMESHPAEAVLNNVVGTRTVGEAAHRGGVETFVFVSSDKAVNPASVMGATKRIGELYVQGMASESRTRFVAVRFGNVLGSNGSVVPTFIDQIRRGGPVTVTHPDMQRFFMSIPEACQLVLQAAAIGTGGEVFILDMGKPVKIVDLARRLIRHAGLRPERDVSIVYSGTRPGEKLHEDLMLTKEGATKTTHPSIWVGRIEAVPWVLLSRALDALEGAAQVLDDAGVARKLNDLVPEYRAAAIVEAKKAGLETRSDAQAPMLQLVPDGPDTDDSGAVNTISGG